ncbi:MAG: CAP domain-containing protein [Anaerolinea sp.]|nr:CAP domain-containing protein [Anaerolinea sp.]
MQHKWIACFLSFLALSLSLISARAQSDSGPQSAQSPAMAYNEFETVYRTNLERRAQGLAPLRSNLQLTEAARWFSWDSVENRAADYCGHQDTLGRWPDVRTRDFGYLGNSGAENAFCGYVTPAQAVQGWMNSPGHRANILDPNSREIGLGYYRRASDGRGYVTQDFGADPAYPPLVIENEALYTTATQVALYLYDRQVSGGFGGFLPAQQMRRSNNRCFLGANWQPYQTESSWTLEGGSGWRTVYAQTRDALGRTATVQDSIYLGGLPPESALSDAVFSSQSSSVTLYQLDGGGLPQMQFSLGWVADDSNETFHQWWGASGSTISDPQALGGSVYRIPSGAGAFAWVWTTDFTANQPFVAYVRLRAPGSLPPGEIGRIWVQAGQDELPQRILYGSDLAGGGFVEFALPFTFRPTSQDPFLLFKFETSGSATLDIDAVTIFSSPVTVQSPYTWTVPGGNYRGQGVWVRYTNGSNTFSEYAEAYTWSSPLSLSSNHVRFIRANNLVPHPVHIAVQQPCGALGLLLQDNAAWLTASLDGDSLQLVADADGLTAGTYSATVTLTPQVSGVAAQTVAVELWVMDGDIQLLHLPTILR